MAIMAMPMRAFCFDFTQNASCCYTSLTLILLSFFWILCATTSAQYFSCRKSQKIRPIRELIQTDWGASMWQHTSCLGEAAVGWDGSCPWPSDLRSDAHSGSTAARGLLNGSVFHPCVPLGFRLWQSEAGKRMKQQLLKQTSLTL